MNNYKLSMQSRNAQQISMFAARFVKVLSERTVYQISAHKVWGFRD